jgi:hypothetical protein
MIGALVDQINLSARSRRDPYSHNTKYGATDYITSCLYCRLKPCLSLCGALTQRGFWCGFRNCGGSDIMLRKYLTWAGNDLALQAR